jgi:NAD(P)H-dependent FMN reductase
MRLTVFNGSPHGLKSNTKILLDQFLDGFHESEQHSCEVVYLQSETNTERLVDLFRESETVILAFPLHADAMPAVVKAFIEQLAPLCGRVGNPRIGFIVQSGFVEAVHSRYVEKYLQKLAARLNCNYLGTVIRGGVEGIQVQPDWMRRETLALFRELGKRFGHEGNFDAKLVHKLAKTERMSRTGLLIFKLLSKTGIINLYWDGILKKNKAFEQRFNKPYI